VLAAVVPEVPERDSAGRARRQSPAGSCGPVGAREAARRRHRARRL